MYKVGDKVVYPHHGAGTVVKREKKEVLGEKREYLTIKILHNDMTVNVPADNADRVGLRKVIDEEAVKKVVKYLTSGGTEMPKNWNRRDRRPPGGRAAPAGAGCARGCGSPAGRRSGRAG